MAYQLFQVPVRDSGVAEEELNRFLRGHRILSVDRRWVDQGAGSFWRGTDVGVPRWVALR